MRFERFLALESLEKVVNVRGGNLKNAEKGSKILSTEDLTIPVLFSDWLVVRISAKNLTSSVQL